MSDLAVRPEQLRALAVPVGGAARVVQELAGQLAASTPAGSAELTEAIAELGAVWGRALHGHGEAVLGVAQRVHGAAETYEAVEALLAAAIHR